MLVSNPSLIGLKHWCATGSHAWQCAGGKHGDITCSGYLDVDCPEHRQTVVQELTTAAAIALAAINRLDFDTMDMRLRDTITQAEIALRETIARAKGGLPCE